ncbi:MAG: hypothetical protein GX678_07795 [Actinomycetales bacterium]|nr:hypothetical protein [Actinomycetales bacterium]
MPAKRAITTATALRLSKALGGDDRFWVNAQTDFNLEIELDLHQAELDKVISLGPANESEST